MNRGIFQRTVLAIAAAVLSMFTPHAFAGGKLETLGRVAVDKYEAVVGFQDCSIDESIFRITLSLRKLRKAPAIPGKRIKVWLLRGDGGANVEFAQEPLLQNLHEEGEGELVTAKAFYFFKADNGRGTLASVVVAVDGEPKVFKMPPPQDNGGVDAKVIAAWQKVGATFSPDGRGRKVPGFLVDDLQLPLTQELPLPAVSFGLYAEATHPPGFLAQLPGRTRAQVLRLEGASLADADRKELASLKQLHTLTLTGARIGDADLKALAGLPQLQSLSLRGTQVSAAGLKDLPGLPQLHTLELSICDLSNGGEKVLASCQQLRVLHLWSCKMSAAGLKVLAGLKQLETLSLGGTEISNVGLKELANLKQLKVLYLGGAKITGAGLKELAGLQQLQTLDLNRWQANDADFQELAHLRQLRVLNLEFSAIGDAGLRGLVGLKELRTLNLKRTKITGAGLKELAGLHELRTLDLDGTRLDDANMKHLAGLKELRLLNLYVTDPGFTGAGFKELASLTHLQRVICAHNPDGADELRKALPWACVAPSR